MTSSRAYGRIPLCPRVRETHSAGSLTATFAFLLVQANESPGSHARRRRKCSPLYIERTSDRLTDKLHLRQHWLVSRAVRADRMSLHFNTRNRSAICRNRTRFLATWTCLAGEQKLIFSRSSCRTLRSPSNHRKDSVAAAWISVSTYPPKN